MKRKIFTILPLAGALGALSSAPAIAALAPTNDFTSSPNQSELAKPTGLTPNTFYTAGQDLLGLVVTQLADGTIVAQHPSHASHGSHASHASHASSRY